MLKEDACAVAELSAEVAGLEAHFAERDPSTSRFLRVILALLAHREPARADLRALRRDYAASFEAMFALIEDAGWRVRAAAACALARRHVQGCGAAATHAALLPTARGRVPRDAATPR